MSISPITAGGNNLHAGEFNNHTVYDITGSVLNFHNTLEKNYKAGDKVVVSFAMVRDNNNVLFEGLEFDGNADGNDHFLSWARHTSLWLTSVGSRANHNRFTHSQGDAISVQGLDNIVENNIFEDLNGSALHLSAARQTIVRSNRMNRTNLKADRVVHAEAAITWSLGNQDILVEHNCIRNVPAAAFGHILVHGNNSGADVRENSICETESLMKVVTNQPLDIDLLFTGNRATNTGTLSLVGLNTHLRGVEISGNRIHNGAIYAKNTDDLLIDDNHISLTDDASLNDDIESANNKFAAVSVFGGRNVEVDGNFISGGRKGVQIYNSLARSEYVTVTGNSLTQQYENALLIGHLNSIDSDDANYSDFSGVTLTDNFVTSDRLSSGRAAVELGRRTDLLGSCIESNQAGARLHGYTVDQSTADTLVRGNRVNAQGESLTARIPYTRGYSLTDNTASSQIVAALLTNNPNSELRDRVTAAYRTERKVDLAA